MTRAASQIGFLFSLWLLREDNVTSKSLWIVHDIIHLETWVKFLYIILSWRRDARMHLGSQSKWMFLLVSMVQLSDFQPQPSCAFPHPFSGSRCATLAAQRRRAPYHTTRTPASGTLCGASIDYFENSSLSPTQCISVCRCVWICAFTLRLPRSNTSALQSEYMQQAGVQNGPWAHTGKPFSPKWVRGISVRWQ